MNATSATFLLVMLAVGGALVAWQRVASRTVRRDGSLSVLLVSIDTLRADALGAYGNRSAATPWIDRLAREGVLFEREQIRENPFLPLFCLMLWIAYIV